MVSFRFLSSVSLSSWSLIFPDLDFIQSSGNFFPVTADKRNGRPFIKQPDRSFNLSGRNVYEVGDEVNGIMLS